MTKPPDRLRPDAWMDWTDFEIDPDNLWGPMLVVRQSDSRIHLTPRLASEMIVALTEWLASPDPETER